MRCALARAAASAGSQQRRQNGNDRNDHEQFDQVNARIFNE